MEKDIIRRYMGIPLFIFGYYKRRKCFDRGYITLLTSMYLYSIYRGGRFGWAEFYKGCRIKEPAGRKRMVRLLERGYVIRIEKGIYRLSDKGVRECLGVIEYIYSLYGVGAVLGEGDKKTLVK
jgi:hypothetical protein